MPSAHALLSPSAAHRWIHCTPSAVLAAKVEDKGSSYAEEGTCAHALCELQLLKALERPFDQAQREYEALASKWYTAEMQEAADLYVSIILDKWHLAQSRDQFAQIYVERRLDFSSYAPESFGTADCVILADGCMEVIDFKFGKGVEVKAEGNPQMLIYALGAYDEFSIGYAIKEVCMTIVQPRIANIDEWRIPIQQLLDWGENTLRPAADAAFVGAGELAPGDHCRFCPVKATCSALAFRAIDAFRFYNARALPPITAPQAAPDESSSPITVPSASPEGPSEDHPSPIDTLPPHIFAEILKLIPSIERWAEAVKEHALALALSGSTPEGFKLVEGRSVRVINNPEALASTLTTALGIGITDSLYKPRELQSLTALEKIVGKKKFNELAKPYIDKPAGKPTLVPVTDKRPALDLDPTASARLDFANLTSN